ncbi:MAG TPA: hypothetical protein VK358_10620 [Longimicrobium sp.]|nr:hypothetical protein [Longimicrobium sp.]
MYRSCIFCSADLKANDALERFPVGRSIAFDGEKGRLWAVCLRCARWNLAPIEERWEAIEDAERLFRDTRTRAQSENIGVARLRDGTRLIRVGAAVGGELAAWRYGGQIASRRWRYFLGVGVGAVAVGGIVLAGSALAGLGGGITYSAYSLVRGARQAIRDRRTVHETSTRAGLRHLPVRVLGKHVRQARIRTDESGAGIELHLPAAIVGRTHASRLDNVSSRPCVLRGDDARLALGRGLVVVNPAGGDRRLVHDAVGRIEQAGGPREMLLAAARNGLLLNGSGGPRHPAARDAALVSFPRGVTPVFPSNDSPNPLVSLAVEMAVHDEMERQALEGELAGLEEAWRQAEQIAAIADRLPDALDPAEPPRIANAG